MSSEDELSFGKGNIQWFSAREKKPDNDRPILTYRHIIVIGKFMKNILIDRYSPERDVFMNDFCFPSISNKVLFWAEYNPPLELLERLNNADK